MMKKLKHKRIKKEQYLQRDAFIFIFPVQALAVGLPAINLLASNIMIGKFIGEVGLAAYGYYSGGKYRPS